ncbi:hypothetical protein KIPE111705_46765 [Kibdelosporangium persicum]|uniref:hypothetical protein n=1 Tax=Kibdelosporangium persicum TaxID=2698649 RepID=UPI001565ADB0|nr:hypothetical protein [Kibdelosporangium persicum]
MAEAFKDFEFGIAGLATAFHQDWSLDATAEQTVRDYLDVTDVEIVTAVAKDAVSLRRGGTYARTLWRACTRGYHRPEDDGLTTWTG